MQFKILRAGFRVRPRAPCSPPRRLAADVTFRRANRRTSWPIPMYWERVATYAMPRARSSRLTQCMFSNTAAGRLLAGAGLKPRWLTMFALLCWPAGAQIPAPAAPAPSPDYAGSEACQTCHEDIYNAFQKNPHAVVGAQKRRGWEGKACESCHGPGAKHASSADKADIVNPAHLAPAQADRDCLKCHLNQPTHIGRIESGHARNEVSCTACHSIHRNGPNGLVPRKIAAVNELCAGCHTAI